MKRKRIISAMLLMTLIATTCSTNVFAGGNASVVTGNQGNNDRTGQTPTTLPYGTDVNGSENNIINGSNNVIINQIQAPVSTKESTDEKEGHLVIGKEIENKKIEDIVSISKDEIKSVTIKNCVTSICESAFAGCTELTSVTIGNGVTGIGSSAFSGCTGLTSVNIPNGVTYIGDGALNDCKGLTSVTIGNCVTSIGDCAFRGCVGLTSITIPDSVTSIGSSAFSGCTGLKEVTVPSSAKIAADAFNKNCLLNKNDIHANNVSNGETNNSMSTGNNQAFANNPDETTYKNNYSNNSMSTGNYQAFANNPDKTTYKNNYSNNSMSTGNNDGHLVVGKEIENKRIEDIVSIPKDKIKSVTIKDGVTKICRRAFYSCTGLTSITIPDSVKSIGDEAFKGCTGLTSVKIGNGVTSIGYCVFKGCTGLKKVTVSRGANIDRSTLFHT